MNCLSKPEVTPDGHIRFAFQLNLLNELPNGLTFDPNNLFHCSILSVNVRNPNADLLNFCEFILNNIAQYFKKQGNVYNFSLNSQLSCESENEEAQSKSIPLIVESGKIGSSNTLRLAHLEFNDEAVEVINVIAELILQMFKTSNYDLIGGNPNDPNYSWIDKFYSEIIHPKTGESVAKFKKQMLEEVGDANCGSLEKHATITYCANDETDFQQKRLKIGLGNLIVGTTDALGRLLLVDKNGNVYRIVQLPE